MKINKIFIKSWIKKSIKSCKLINQKTQKSNTKAPSSESAITPHHGLLIFKPSSSILRHNLPAISNGSSRSQHAVLLWRPLLMQSNVTSCISLYRSSSHNGSFLQPSRCRAHKFTSSCDIAGLTVLCYGVQAGCTSN